MSLRKTHAALLFLIPSIAIAGCSQSSPSMVSAETVTRNLTEPPALAPVTSTPTIGPIQTSIPPTATTEPTQTGISALTIEPTQTEIPKPIFDRFVETVKTGEKGKIVGIWAENKLALQVVYQPSNDPAFVSTQKGTATYFLYVFQQAANRGFLAHNYLSGQLFFGLKLGDIVQVVYGDGSYEDFEVLDIREYQALSPESLTSNFVDLTSGEQLSSSQLFMKVYQGDYRTTLQTCIARGSEGSWGRIFVIAPLLP